MYLFNLLMTCNNLNCYYYPILTNLNLNKVVWIYLLVLHEITQNYTHI